jgi:hypothetical protein
MYQIFSQRGDQPLARRPPRYWWMNRRQAPSEWGRPLTGSAAAAARPRRAFREPLSADDYGGRSAGSGGSGTRAAAAVAAPRGGEEDSSLPHDHQVRKIDGLPGKGDQDGRLGAQPLRHRPRIDPLAVNLATNDVLQVVARDLLCDRKLIPCHGRHAVTRLPLHVARLRLVIADRRSQHYAAFLIHRGAAEDGRGTGRGAILRCRAGRPRLRGGVFSRVREPGSRPATPVKP